MQKQPAITFRNMEPDPVIEDQLNQHLEKLERIHQRITGCQVTVDVPHQHKTHGNQYAIRIDITVPGDEIVVARDPHESHRHEDLQAVIHDAFKTAERLLEDYARQIRGH